MSRNLSKLVKKRSVYRQTATKLIGKIDGTLALNMIPWDEVAELDKQLEILNKEMEKINEVVEDLIDEEVYEEEVTTSYEYHEKIVECRTRIKLLRGRSKSADAKEIETSCREEEPADNEASISNEDSRHNDTDVLRLPKLEIARYYGDPTNWLEFWQQFDAAIHSNGKLNKVQKFSYLRSYLGGTALNAVAGFRLSSENYSSAVSLLQDRFGRKELIVNSLMSKLLNIEPCKSSNNLKALRQTHDTLEIQIRSLEALDVTPDTYGQLLYPILIKIIPDDIVLEFHRKITGSKEANALELIRFLKAEVECREVSLALNSFGSNSYGFKQGYGNKEKAKYPTYSPSRYVKKAHELLVPVDEDNCLFCNERHSSGNCEASTVSERRELLKRQGRCFLCLKHNHLVRFCKTKERCNICNGKHNRVICFKQKEESEFPERGIVSAVSQSETSRRDKTQVFLQTCTAIGRNGNKSGHIKMLLDTGSVRTFVTKEVSKRLNLSVLRKEKLTICVFGETEGEEKLFNVVKIVLENRSDPHRKIEVEALETDEISAARISSPNVKMVKLSKLKGLQLADCYESTKKKIDVLVGVDYYFQIATGRIKRLSDNLVATETRFGWCVVGQSNSNKLLSLNILNENEVISDQLRSFWELESLGIESDENVENQKDILEDFKRNVSFEDRRYTVKLPWKLECKPMLGNNWDVAKSRFARLRSKFVADRNLFADYKSVIDGYLEEGIIEPVPVGDEPDGSLFYLPHRAVIREDKSTTKLRIVFDASSHEKGKPSLNDCLHTGLNLNPDLFLLLIRFREKPIAFTADIKQAFLQICIDPVDRDATRFFWDSDPYDKEERSVEIMRMTRVLFGVTSSPFLLSATIKGHLERYMQDFSYTVEVLSSSLYVDDLITSQENVEMALMVSKESDHIFKEASMNLRKWKTNSKELRERWKCTEGIGETLEDSEKEIIKVLGVAWDIEEDVLHFNCESLEKFVKTPVNTKRFLLQAAGRVFDPIGFISPFVIVIKCIIQDVWCLGLGWDEEIPDDIKKRLVKWCREVKELSDIKIYRYYLRGSFGEEVELLQLHCFSDASQRAYGCVVYLRAVMKNRQIHTSFVSSKSRVAPLKTISLPRLELMGALLAAKLGKRIADSLSLKVSLRFWTDSTITYFWVKGSSERFKPFVKNRVQEIQSLSNPVDWSHCPGKDNPADLVSRGLEATELKNNKLWWEGPRWLSQPQNFWPTQPISGECSKTVELTKAEFKGCAVNLVSTEADPSFLIEKYSSLSKLLRVTAWCLRFAKNCRNPNQVRGHLSSMEINEAALKLVKIVQSLEFKQEITALKQGKALPSNSKLLSLNVFLDENEMLRVGGRLRLSNLADEQKHQLILPKANRLTELIIEYYHMKSLHSGIQGTLSFIRQMYWIPAGRDRIRKVISKCIPCFRVKSKCLTQMMGDLPKDRIVPSRPFSKVGVDFAGPVRTKPNGRRSRLIFKSYIALFVCLSTKAVHLEVVSDLTAQAFVASFRRFIARRARPSDIYSDNGTNFVGANNYLKNLFSHCRSQTVQKLSADEGINWHFIPPLAPNFGGLWESNIKTMKRHLIKASNGAVLTFEELTTLVAQIEACMNSRPLVPVSSDPEDLQPLTPGHFLVGAPLLDLPEKEPIQNISLTSRWALLQELQSRFWRRWSQDYLNELQIRGKWTKSSSNIQPGQLVVIKEKNQPPQCWKMARVKEVFHGPDGIIRVVILKTANGEVKRTVSNLCPLPVPCVEPVVQRGAACLHTLVI